MPRGVRCAVNVQKEAPASPISPASSASNLDSAKASTKSSKPQKLMREVGPTSSSPKIAQSTASTGPGKSPDQNGPDSSNGNSANEHQQLPPNGPYWAPNGWPAFPIPPSQSMLFSDALGGPMGNPMAQLAAFQAAATANPFMGQFPQTGPGAQFFHGPANGAAAAAMPSFPGVPGVPGAQPLDPRAFASQVPQTDASGNPLAAGSLLAAVSPLAAAAAPVPPETQETAGGSTQLKTESSAGDARTKQDGADVSADAADGNKPAVGEPPVKPEMNAIHQQLMQVLQAEIGLGHWRAMIMQQLLTMGYSLEQTQMLMALSYSSTSRPYGFGSPFGGMSYMAPLNPFAFLNPQQPSPQMLNSQWPYNANANAFPSEPAGEPGSPSSQKPLGVPNTQAASAKAKPDPQQPHSLKQNNPVVNTQSVPKPHGGDRRGHFAKMVTPIAARNGKEDSGNHDPSLKRVTLSRTGRGNNEAPGLPTISDIHDERMYQHQLMMSQQLRSGDVRYLQVNPQPARPSTQPPPSVNQTTTFTADLPLSLQKDDLAAVAAPVPKNASPPTRDVARDSALYPTFSLNPGKFGRKNPASVNATTPHQPPVSLFPRNPFQAFVHPQTETQPPDNDTAQMQQAIGGKPKHGFLLNPPPPTVPKPKSTRPRGRPRESPKEPPRQKRKYTKRGTKEHFKPEPIVEYGEDAPPSKRLRSQRKAAMDWPVFGRGPHTKPNNPMAVPPGAPPPVMPLTIKDDDDADDEVPSDEPNDSHESSSESESESAKGSSSESDSSSDSARPVHGRRGRKKSV